MHGLRAHLALLAAWSDLWSTRDALEHQTREVLVDPAVVSQWVVVLGDNDSHTPCLIRRIVFNSQTKEKKLRTNEMAPQTQRTIIATSLK